MFVALVASAAVALETSVVKLLATALILAIVFAFTAYADNMVEVSEIFTFNASAASALVFSALILATVLERIA